MKLAREAVKSEGRTVGYVEVEIAEDIDEAITMFGEDFVLNTANKQTVTNIANKKRRKFVEIRAETEKIRGILHAAAYRELRNGNSDLGDRLDECDTLEELKALRDSLPPSVLLAK